MTPLSEAVTELRMVVDRAEALAYSAPPAGCTPYRINTRPTSLEDLRTETVASLLDAMDRIDSGLGTRLMLVLYPHCDAQRAYA